MLKFDDMPDWLMSMEVEDVNFIKKFVLTSGSLKDMAKIYGITYPTLRIRLDKLIEKVEMYDKEITDSFIEKVKAMALDGKMDLETAKQLISEYKQRKSK